MLRSSIEAHSKFLKSGEIFYPPEDDIGQSQFFSLVKQMSQSDDGIYTRKQETMNELFERYIALLRDHLQFHEKNFVLADVKYSSTHHLNTSWQEPCGAPYLFSLCRQHHIKILHLIRKNPVHKYLSRVFASATGTYILTNGIESNQNTAVTLDLDNCLGEIAAIDEKVKVFELFLAENNCMTIYYEDLISDARQGVARQLSQYLETEISLHSFSTQKIVRNHDELFSNWNEFRKVIAQSPFASWLDPALHTPS